MDFNKLNFYQNIKLIQFVIKLLGTSVIEKLGDDLQNSFP